MADFFLRPPTLTASNFKALSAIDPIFTVLKDLNLLKNYTKSQKASYNFKLDFALSNRLHFNSVYLARVPFLTGIAVYVDYMYNLESRNFLYDSTKKSGKRDTAHHDYKYFSFVCS